MRRNQSNQISEISLAKAMTRLKIILASFELTRTNPYQLLISSHERDGEGIGRDVVRR